MLWCDYSTVCLLLYHGTYSLEVITIVDPGHELDLDLLTIFVHTWSLSCCLYHCNYLDLDFLFMIPNFMIFADVNFFLASSGQAA